MSGIGSPWFFASLGYSISRKLGWGFFALFAFLLAGDSEWWGVVAVLWLLFEFLAEAIQNSWINKCLKARGEESAIGFDLPEPGERMKTWAERVRERLDLQTARR